MTNQELNIYLTIMDLIEDIKLNNLEAAKIKVNSLNETFESYQDSIGMINEYIPFFELSFQLENLDTLMYVLNNLNNIMNVEKIKWNIEVRELVKYKNLKNIKIFLEDIILKNDIKDYQIPQLIQLATILNDQPILLNIRTLLKNKTNN